MYIIDGINESIKNIKTKMLVLSIKMSMNKCLCTIMESYDVCFDPMQTVINPIKSNEVDARRITSYTERHNGLVRNPRDSGAPVEKQI